MFRDSVRKFLETEAMPHHEQWEKDGMVSDEIWLKAGEQGFLCPTVPEEYGGVGVDFRYNCIVNEEIGHAGCTGLGWTLHSDIAVPYIVRYGSEEQKQRFLPRCVWSFGGPSFSTHQGASECGIQPRTTSSQQMAASRLLYCVHPTKVGACSCG